MKVGAEHAGCRRDVVATANSSGSPTWTGYFGPYGEAASGSGPPDTSIAGATYGYNGSQGKLTVGDIVLMGPRPYQPGTGRFLTVDPVDGGCANAYTYGFGDPINGPDLTGRGGCPTRNSDQGSRAINPFVSIDATQKIVEIAFGAGADVLTCIFGSLKGDFKGCEALNGNAESGTIVDLPADIKELGRDIVAMIDQTKAQFDGITSMLAPQPAYCLAPRQFGGGHGSSPAA